jgi:Endosomal/lysosomal potassium channel TMEM175
MNERPYPRGSYVRGRDLEFDRALYFSDAVYAIAMTLLVVGIALPVLAGNEDKPQEPGRRAR